MKLFWLVSSLLWCVLGIITGNPSYFACMYGCIILQEMAKKEDK